MERIASINGIKKVWMWHYGTFVLWNALTTFWVCNATVAGGIFAILANSLQMSLVFGLFRFSKKYLKGALPYIFLAVTWIAWERAYYGAQISWPWLVLGNSFAGSPSCVQWYEYTGTLGGSLWIWAANLGLFGIMTALSDGSWNAYNKPAKFSAIAGYAVILAGPLILSEIIYMKYEETDDPLAVTIVQPNIDPYSKFEFLSQQQQNVILLDQMKEALKSGYKNDTTGKPLLVVAPETFTSDIITNDFNESRTYRRFVAFLKDYPNTNLLFGASSHEFIYGTKAPSYTARKYSDGIWVESHNSAMITDGTGRGDIYHKTKLVVGAEMTPYPALFCKIDNMLGGVMGRDIGQKNITLLHCRSYNADGSVKRSIPVGTAVCYESVYGEYCTGYIKAGAEALTIITNDAWWGDTPGYRQHLRYASLRAIETRRDIARCGNTGISAIIDQRGDILKKSGWWKQDIIKGDINLNSKMTFFVLEGDITGKICTFMFLLLFLAVIVRVFVPEKR
jgi:apolipoprotein N-acyltransferase